MTSKAPQKNKTTLLILLVAVACLLGGSVIIGGFLFEFSDSELSGTDCRPRKLRHMTSCRGEDRSFQECLFYFRAEGIPVTEWCTRLGKEASPASDPAPDCNVDRPETWRRVACETYHLPTDYDCFACTPNIGHETNKAYIYAYDAECVTGIEQVTCNVDPKIVGDMLGK